MDNNSTEVVDAQAVTLSEVVAWLGVALWGGVLVAWIISDLVRWYRKRAEAGEQRDGLSGRHGDAR